MPAPSKAAVEVWVGLVRAHAKALDTVESALKQAGLPALEWYDVLLELERTGPLRPRELQARLLLPQSNLSRLVDRMAVRGLVEKQRSPSIADGRGQLVAITTLGARLRKRIWPVYAAAITEAVGARLAEPEARRVAAGLRRIAS